jgi:hypothetical protein
VDQIWLPAAQEGKDMAAYRYIRILRKSEEIELQSTDELAFTQLVGDLSKSTCRVCLASREPAFSYFHHCRFSGSSEHMERAWELIAERLAKEGWVRLDNSPAAVVGCDGLMYFGKGRPASHPKKKDLAPPA